MFNNYSLNNDLFDALVNNDIFGLKYINLSKPHKNFIRGSFLINW